MEPKINIGYSQVFELVCQLPDKDIQKLLKQLQIKIKRTDQHFEKPTPIQKLILQAPTWTDEEYNDYLEARKHINQSRLK